MKRTPSESMTVLTGLLAIGLSGAFALFCLLVPILNRRLAKPIDIGNDLSFPFLLSVLALALTYVYARLEQIAEKQTELLNRPFTGVEEYNSSAQLLVRLADLSVGAEKISTLNLSSPMGTHQGLDTYFHKLHAYILGHDSRLNSFQSLALVDSEAKLDWVIKRTAILNPSGHASLAILRQNNLGAIPLGFHIVYRDGQGFVFFYPPVDLTGQMRCFLVKNTQIADIMQFYFDLLWSGSAQICAGGRIFEAGLQFAEGLFPNICSDPTFLRLRKKAI